MPPKKKATPVEAGSSVVNSKEKTKRDFLYERCAKEPTGKIFALHDLRAFGLAEDDGELTDLAQELVDRMLFALLQVQQAFCYRVRPRDIAKKLVFPNNTTTFSLSIYFEMFCA
jgi:hypothetical protein